MTSTLNLENLEQSFRAYHSRIAWVLLVMVLISIPPARAQDACAQLRASIQQLNQQIQTGINRGNPREQVNHDIDLRNRQVNIYNQRCAGSGGSVGSVSPSQNRFGTAIQLLSLIAPLLARNDAAADAAADAVAAERDRMRALQEIEQQRRELARLEDEARQAGTLSVRQQAQSREEDDRRWRQSQTNPFAASTGPPTHEIRTFPGTKIETQLVERKTEPAPARPDCPSDTPGATPGGYSLGGDCIRPRGGGGPARQPENSSGGPMAHVDLSRPAPTFMKPLAGHGEQPLRTDGADAKAFLRGGSGNTGGGTQGAGNRPGDIQVVIGNPNPPLPFGGRRDRTPNAPVEGGGGIEVATGCVKGDRWEIDRQRWDLPNYPREEGAPGRYYLRNNCAYRVFAGHCIDLVEKPGHLNRVCDWVDMLPNSVSGAHYADRVAMQGNTAYIHYYACRSTWPQYNGAEAQNHACYQDVMAWVRRSGR